MGEITKNNNENRDIENLGYSLIKGVTSPLGDRVAETIQSRFSIREDINTPESIEKIRNAFSFYKNEVLPLILENPKVTQQKEGYHGLYTHTKNVVFRGICYAVSLGEDPIPVVFACACHDLARVNDGGENVHGPKAIPVTTEIINNEKFNLTEEQKQQIIEAVRDHTTGKGGEAPNYISACLRDADRTRLSRDRGYKESCYNTEIGKKVGSGSREEFTEFQNLCVNTEYKEPDTITPEEFKSTLRDRDDVDYLKEKGYMTSPDMLMLYDKVVALQRIKSLQKYERRNFFESLLYTISHYGEAKACLQIIPTLINDGYDLDIISNLAIREDNKDIIKNLLDDNEIIEFLNKKVLEETANLEVSEGDAWGREKPVSLEDIEKDRKKKFIEKISKISKFINVDNFKYLKDCLESKVMVDFLPYFNSDTKKIIEKYLSGYKYYSESTQGVLDRIHRRGHTLQSISEIFGDEPITPLTEHLLEFKDFNKFKNIGITEFKDLSIEDKKSFLNSFISALTPHDIGYPEQHGLNENFQDLQKRMKIFKEFNWSENYNERMKSYNDIIRSLLNLIPDADRNISINTGENPIHFRKEYREKNLIPPLVDDISKVLDIHIENIKGRRVKVAEMDDKSDLGISTHKFPSICAVEALEITDNNIFLCVSTKGGQEKIKTYSGGGYHLVTKPRKIGDLYIQSNTDADSGTGSMKNLYTYEYVKLPFVENSDTHISLIPNAIKEELNLSQEEYTKRINALGNVTTLQEVGEKDKELELAIRKVLKVTKLSEGITSPTVMGVLIRDKNLDDVDDDILDYCVRRDIPLIRVKGGD